MDRAPPGRGGRGVSREGYRLSAWDGGPRCGAKVQRIRAAWADAAPRKCSAPGPQRLTRKQYRKLMEQLRDLRDEERRLKMKEWEAR